VSIEANKAVVMRVVDEMWNRGDAAAVEELIAPSMVEHGAFGTGTGGRDDARDTVERFRSGFPDLVLEAEGLIAEGDRVVLHWVGRGTHEGEFMGVPPTGTRVEIAAVAMVRIHEGKIAEMRGAPDMLGLMQQIGAVPAPEPSEEASPT
jgi:steroid delta-isomerase-like uncharacterized protein